MSQTREIIYDNAGNVVHVASKGKLSLRNTTTSVTHVTAKKKNKVYRIDETDDELDKFYITSSTPILQPKKVKVEDKQSVVEEPRKIETTNVDLARQMNYPLSMFQNIQLRWRMRGPRN